MQVTILDDEARSRTLINHLNTTAVDVTSKTFSAGVIAIITVTSRTYFNDVVAADSNDLFVVQIREKVRPAVLSSSSLPSLLLCVFSHCACFCKHNSTMRLFVWSGKCVEHGAWVPGWPRTVRLSRPAGRIHGRV
jgi:hypothetical protein